jgi:hypothetical protein
MMFMMLLFVVGGGRFKFIDEVHWKQKWYYTEPKNSFVSSTKPKNGFVGATKLLKKVPRCLKSLRDGFAWKYET